MQTIIAHSMKLHHWCKASTKSCQLLFLTVLKEDNNNLQNFNVTLKILHILLELQNIIITFYLASGVQTVVYRHLFKIHKWEAKYYWFPKKIVYGASWLNMAHWTSPKQRWQLCMRMLIYNYLMFISYTFICLFCVQMLKHLFQYSRSQWFHHRMVNWTPGIEHRRTPGWRNRG